MESPFVILKNWLRPQQRLKPGFIIIGAQKAGTSALHSMLSEHPKLLASQPKELHFFDNDDQFNRGIEHYLMQFPLGEKGQIAFESTPRYLVESEYAHRIHEHFPGMKLVVLLRDPISRAYSAWNMYHNFKEHPKFSAYYDPRTFDQAVQEELEGIGTSDYVRRGYYADQLDSYFSLFGREQVMVISYSALKYSAYHVVNGILRFLGQEEFEEDFTKGVQKNRRSYDEPIAESMTELLKDHYKPYNERLLTLLGTDFKF